MGRTKVEPGVTITERGGVCVKFPEQPSDEIRAELKAAGFRFRRKSMGWWQKATEENVEVARNLWAAFEDQGGVDA